ncbi:hypothetical protein BHE74_00011039 [Ensete ventricosum]|nr:hypothetical protein BHE74_00011039 [Ensete ventricosum]
MIEIGRAAPETRFSLVFFLPRMIPPKIDRPWSKSTVTDRFRVVTERKQSQSAIPPDSGQSVFRSAGELVRTVQFETSNLASQQGLQFRIVQVY